MSKELAAKLVRDYCSKLGGISEARAILERAYCIFSISHLFCIDKPRLSRLEHSLALYSAYFYHGTSNHWRRKRGELNDSP